MKCLVTGAAGFIGSHLSEALLASGHDVVGIDAFIPYYPSQVKESNLASSMSHPRFQLAAIDLRDAPLDRAMAGVEVVFHLAAMPGLPRSWTDFDLYQSCNIVATQRLVEASRHNRQLKKFIYASTSSVYGRFGSGDESLPAKPISPYGVTKYAAEQLCRAYAEEFDLPLVVLRYFSVYGPRQRPDMGYYKFIKALLCDEPITVFGSGQQVRGNTFISDCVAATVAAANAPSGEVYNVGGGETASVWDVIRKLESIVRCSARTTTAPARPGDQQQTTAATNRIASQLGWRPHVGLEEGLKRQVEWQRTILGDSAQAA